MFIPPDSIANGGEVSIVARTRSGRSVAFAAFDDLSTTPNGGYIKFNPQKTKRDKAIKGYAVTSKFLHDVEFDKQERIYDEKCPMSIIQFKKDKKREHTSQKPIALFEYLIKSYSD